ncbi:acetyl-CoA synthetase-like protein [Obba rivulosa]|uniref:Acetyl-CoA synthetase-like protein n=1 Tax=Obba rivulosa TaxID=1052685 RepID=A0A8E2J6M8_9APHY|nr:acetyl-CoA synthetase-like protein [Obba rivulosa]
MSCKTHLTVLQDKAALYPSAPAFLVPELSSESDKVQAWTPITYSQFLADVELAARYWTATLAGLGLPRHAVIGLWLGGMTYTDVLHIYGMARAGYVPQLFSLRLPNPDVIYELLQRANAKALVYEASFAPIVTDSPLPIFIAANIYDADVDAVPLPPLDEEVNPDDTVMIFHTSGSTSGSPKLIPCSYSWLKTIVEKAAHVSKPHNFERQDVTVWMGSMCHIAQTFMLIGALQYGSCTIQPTQIAFPSDELLDMVHRCRLNRLNQFATFLAVHLRNSRRDPKLLAVLQGLDEVLYAGLTLAREEEEWAYQNGILLRNLFGNTECGAMLLSIGGKDEDSSYLRPIEGTAYDFCPTDPTPEGDAAYENVNARLLELVIRSDSGDCPDPSLRQADGHYHTGDLFLEVKDGCYVFRGRDDDWIKSENSLRCDTKAIEDNVRSTCGELIAECIVVGNGRPSPVLFVEPMGDVPAERLKKDIIRRTRHFHSRRYLHERITSTAFVVVVPRDTLPRTATKGNIRRKAVEEQFKAELDQIYGVAA